jgi:gas vesicle protein
MRPESESLSSLNYEHGDSMTSGPGDLSKVLIGAAAGAAIGALIGGAFTEKGKATTRRVAKSTQKMANNVKNKVSTAASGVADSLSQTYTAAKEGVTEVLERKRQNMGSEGTTYGGSTSTNL